jgi:LysR family transcriptional regulator for metE and metH
MHLEIRHLRLVAAIAETGSVTRAAERVYLTQPALSHQLRDIEGRLGVPLFRRAGKRMVPSAAGERVLASARRILADLQTVENEIAREAAGGPDGLIRLTTECYTCYHWLAPVLATFHAQWPNIEVQVVAEATRRSLRALAAGEIDLAVTTRAPRTKRFRYAPLFVDEMVLIVPPGHDLASKPYIEPHDLEGRPLVLYTMPEEESTLLMEVLRPAQVQPGRIHWVQLTEAIIELVKAGVGVGALATWAVAPHIATGQLVAVPLRRGGLLRQWHVATRADRPLADYQAAFIEMVRQASFIPRPELVALKKKNPRLIA